MTKEDIIYNQMLNIVKYINKKVDEGWILLDAKNNIEDAKIVEYDFGDAKGIYLKYDEKSYGAIVEYNSTEIYGESTLFKEYKAGLYTLKKFKLLEPKKIHTLKSNYII